MLTRPLRRPDARSSRRARRTTRRLSVLAALVAGTVCYAAGTAAGASRTAAAEKPPGCGLVPASVVGAVYKAPVGPPLAETKGPVTVCNFFSTAPLVSVLVRFEVGESAAQFAATRKQFEQRHDHTVTQPGFGQMAYSVVLGSGKTLTSTIVVLTGSTELLVTGTGALSRAETLARDTLRKLDA